MIKIMIADDNLDLCNILKDLLIYSRKFEVVGVVHNGKDAYDLIKKCNPDVAIIDLMMPVWDGIEVIKRIYLENINPNMVKLILTAESKSDIVQIILDYDAYYFQKPFDSDLLIDRILCYYKVHSSFNQNNYNLEKQHEEIKNRVSDILLQQGKCLNNKGYKFFLDAAAITYYKEDALCNITQNIYNPIAIKYNTNSSNIERQMRYCINKNINTIKNNTFLSRLFKKTHSNYIDKNGKTTHPISVQEMLQSVINQLKQGS